MGVGLKGYDSELCGGAGTVTVEHMQDMMWGEHMAACVERMRRLPPVEVRVLQLVAHQDHKGRRKGEGLCHSHSTPEPTLSSIVLCQPCWFRVKGVKFAGFHALLPDLAPL